MKCQHILVPIDIEHSISWIPSLRVAVEMARNFSAKLTIATVVRDIESIFQSYFPPGYTWMHEQVARELKGIVEEQIPADLKPNLEIGHGSIAREVVRIARDCQVDLIVLAAHRPELKDYLLGTHAAAIVRHAPCSVFVVREQDDVE